MLIKTAAGAATLLALLCTAGCSSRDEPVEMLADYNGRIERILGQSLPVTAPVGVPTWPASHDIGQPVTDLRVGVFARLDVARCGMLREFLERQGSPGRIGAPSQQLLYEMRLLRGLRQCETLTAPDLASPDPAAREFATTVRNVLEMKRRDLPAVYWNATFGAGEFREFFTVAALPIKTGESTQVPSAASAIAWLAALGTMAPDAPLPAPDAMETRYFQLIGNKLGARLWLSLDLATRELDRSSTLLERAQDLCPAGNPTRRADQLRNVFQGKYMTRVQPWLAQVSRDSHAIAGALEKLWAAQQVSPPPAVTQYRERTFGPGPRALRARFDGAQRRHVLAWKRALAACEFTPAQQPATR